jgi:hypothetical protein
MNIKGEDMLYRYRMFNKPRLIMILILLLGMFLYWYISGGMYGATLGFNPNAADIAGRSDTVQKALILQLKNLDDYTDILGFSSTIVPLMIFFTSALFFEEKNGLYIFAFSRMGKRKDILKSILFYALYNAAVIYLIYVIYLTAGVVWIGKNIEIERNLFDGIFGKGFGDSIAYFYVEGFIPYFIGSFVYTYFSCCIALFARRKYQCILVPMVYYWGLNIIVEFIRNLINEKVSYQFIKFEPTFVYGYQGFIYDNPTVFTVLSVCLSLILPAVASVIMIKIYNSTDFA